MICFFKAKSERIDVSSPSSSVILNGNVTGVLVPNLMNDIFGIAENVSRYFMMTSLLLRKASHPEISTLDISA